MRERGLKLPDVIIMENVEDVAPFAGAWIEITKEKAMKVLDMSLPLRERGLKYADSYS